MRKIPMTLAASAILLVCLASCGTTDLRKVRTMQIKDIDLATVRDGTYEGAYAYGRFTYEVRVTIEGHAIASIDIVKNRDTAHAKDAEAVIDRVLAAQKTDVDAVSGATTTSKALLKAIETAIEKGADETAQSPK